MRKTERRRAAETQSEELNFAPLQLGDSALNASAPAPAPKGRKTLAQGNALGPVPEDAPSAERAQEAELPGGWQFIPFTETICAARARVVKVQQSNYRESGRFPIIDQGQEFIAGYWDGEDDIYRDGLPVIVFGDHTRIFKFVDFPFVAGADGTHVLVPDRSRFEPFFLYLALSSLDIPSRGYNRHFRLLKERSIVTPPLPEQRAIAAVLRTVQRAKEACERVLAATRQLKQSLLHHLFTYGPVPLAQAAHVPLKETEAGPMPEHWSVVPIREIETFMQYGTSSRCESDGPGLPVLRIPNVIGGRIDTGDLKYLAASPVEIERHLLQRGDLLFVRTNGVRENVGRCAVYLGSPARSLFASYLIRARLAPDRALPEFVQLFTETNTGRASFTGRASGAADGKFNINTQTIRSTILPLPPLPEQREIVEQLSAVDAKLATEESRRAALASLFQSLLHHLMRGKVRLPGFIK